MTLDEAIAKYNKLANNDQTCYPEEAQQLAEWLEELKAYRASVFSGDMTQKMLKEEYCKAVDDFAELVEKWCWKHQYYNQDDLNELVEIAGQLKGGGVDE